MEGETKMSTDPVKRTEFKKSISWRVTSTRGEFTDAGYWTSSYSNRANALEHAQTMKKSAAKGGVACYEVTDEFMYEDGKLVQHVSETWRLLI